ncbi:MAG TPA: discoidin domain-containing protein [Armatimonadota bacterium]|nr:discoidin domain-containing protein [Armatimonadota bacterium]
MFVKALIGLLLTTISLGNAMGATYYLDSVGGDDGNKGTSESAPWKSSEKVNTLTLGPGDKVLFKRNCQFRGTLILHGNGSSKNPIAVDAYGKGCKPVLIGDEATKADCVIMLQDLPYYLLKNLEIQAPRTSGIILQGCSHATVRDCDFTNIAYLPPGMPEGGDIWSVIIDAGKTDGSDNLVTHCTFKKCSKGVIIFSGDDNILSDSYFFDINDIAALFAGHCRGKIVTNSRITRCIFDYTNNTGLGWNPVMFGGTDNCYEEYCETKNTPAGQWDHQVYDFDTNCRNSYIQYNYSHDNLGDLMHSYWMGDSTGNGPCYFRYNISVNDKTLYNKVKTTYGLQMHNNTFHDFGGNFGRNIVASDLSDTVVKDNIFHMKLGAGVDSFPAGSDFNCYYHCSKPSGEAHSMRANPEFVNASRPPHGLQLSPNSPCKNAGESGVDIGAPIPAFTGSLALNCPVTAGSSMEKDSWGRSKVVDGTINTEPNTCGWRSSGNEAVDHEEWITLDLEKDYKINRVVLYPRNDTGYIGAGFPRTFRIRTSRDNVNWTAVSAKKDYPQPGDAPQYFSFGDRTARYVNILMTGLRQDVDGKYAAALAEIEVFDDKSPVPPTYPPIGNLALNKDVTASSSAENSAWYKVKLLDGMRKSAADAFGWSTDPSFKTNRTEWVKVDLGAACSVSRVDLYPRNDSGNVGTDFPVDFTIDISTDNVTWTPVVQKTGYPQPTDGRVQSFSFKAAKARWVRMNAINLRPNAAGNYGMALAEMEVYEE